MKRIDDFGHLRGIEREDSPLQTMLFRDPEQPLLTQGRRSLGGNFDQDSPRSIQGNQKRSCLGAAGDRNVGGGGLEYALRRAYVRDRTHEVGLQTSRD